MGDQAHGKSEGFMDVTVPNETWRSPGQETQLRLRPCVCVKP